jgi:3-mercaptopyruvate sulfurtransferase SseA
MTDYANPDALVTTEWLAANLTDPLLRIIEVDEDTGAYEHGHIPGAVAWDWAADLHHPIQEQPDVGGQVPGAANIPWSKAANEDGSFESADDLAALYGAAGVTGDSAVVAYCRIGERSSHTWFVLHELLGYRNVANCDGSWTEYGSLVGAPVER